MKKPVALYLLLPALALMLSTRAEAQTPIAPQEPLVNQYVADAYSQRSATWWDALGRQLELQLDKPYDQVDETTLQNVIFFATHHGDKVKLNDATPRLLDVYKNHEREEFRMMALAGLHAIGDERTMQALYEVFEDQPSEHVRRLTAAVLIDHRHRNPR